MQLRGKPDTSRGGTGQCFEDDVCRNDLGTVNGHHPRQNQSPSNRLGMEGRHVPTRSGQIDGPAAKRAGTKVATAARLAWSLCVACLVGLGGYLLLYVLNGTAGLGSLPLPAALTFTVVGALFAVVGALVASRQPDNKVGWLLLAAGLCIAVNSLGESYARYALVTAPGSLPGGLFAAWIQAALFGMVAILAIFLPLYFPTGRLLSRRWRPILWAGIGYLVCAVVGNNLQPGPVEWLPGAAPAPNPVIYLPAAKPLFEVILALSAPCFLVGGWGHRCAGGAVPALPRDRAPAAEVVHLRGRAGPAVLPGL
jgi:hypothetical protein